jgi:predicted Zn-dependent protease with MMP-like domain
MIMVSRKEFEELVDRVVVQLPDTYLSRLKNVAILVQDEPDMAQRHKLMLRPNQSLFGLYEGVPLTQRQGVVKILPDKITIFQKPLEYASNNMNDLFQNLGRTVWHEVAHYFGLNHDQINELESKEKNKES